MLNTGVAIKKIIKYQKGRFIDTTDDIVEERALQIVLRNEEGTHPLLITMRTPLYDYEMILGYLYCEGIIAQASDVLNMRYFPSQLDNSDALDKMIVDLKKNINLKALNPSFVSFSSCGLCGKTNLGKDAFIHFNPTSTKLSITLLNKIRQDFGKHQSLFQKTGGLHAAAFYSSQGKFTVLHEDIGRHNALDKIIGHFAKNDLLPAQDYVLMLTSRISYEMVSKCIAAGVQIICGIGPASSLSIELAEEYGVTIIGFLKEDSFNIYAGFDRIDQGKG